ncbi:hypothetical protein BH10PLA2_BH10PLA2_31910 [soil metagenome]
MNRSTESASPTARISEPGVSNRNCVARSLTSLGAVIPALIPGSGSYIGRNISKLMLSWGCLAVAVVLVSKPCSGKQLETQNWNLPRLVEHLNDSQHSFSVVPTQKSGNWSNSVYLSNRPEAEWQSLQSLIRSVEKKNDWNGVVLIERISDKPGPQWDVSQWGNNGLQIGRFILFGDETMIRQINTAMTVQPSNCVLKRLFSCE